MSSGASDGKIYASLIFMRTSIILFLVTEQEIKWELQLFIHLQKPKVEQEELIITETLLIYYAKAHILLFVF